MKTSFIFFSLLFCLLANAQKSATAPQEVQVGTTLTSDFERASTLNGQGQYEEGIQLLKEILSKLPAEKEKSKNPEAYNEVEVSAIYELAYGYLSLNQLEKANDFCNQAIRKSESTRNIPLAIESYNLSGVIHKRRFMLDKGIEQYKKALELNRTQDNHRLSSIIMNNIASLYTELEKNKEALEMGRQMMLYLPAGKKDTQESHIEYLLQLNTLGVLLDNAALSQHAVDTLGMAVHEIKQSRHNTPDGLKLLLYSNYAKSLNNIGAVDSARYYYNHALALIPTTTNPYNVANLHYLYGCLLKNKLKMPQQARQHLNQALEFYRKNPSGVLPKCLEEAADLEATAFNNSATAYALLSEAFQSYRTHTQKQYQDKLSGFEAEFKTREKEMKIKELNMQRESEQTKHQIQLIGTLSILFIALLIIIMLTFLSRKKKAEFTLKALSLQHAIAQKSHEIETLTTEMTQKMTEKYINGIEDSHQRIAGELHDGVCNKLLALNMSIRNTANAPLTEELTEVYNELRILSHELASPEFSTITLNQMLDIYIDKLKQANLFALIYFIDPQVEAIRFNQTVAHEIYRIIQEALSNIIKHAAANSVDITISENQGTVEIMIEDDGKGYDTLTSTEGIGLRMMKERAAALKATFSIESTPNQGTVLLVAIPYC